MTRPNSVLPLATALAALLPLAAVAQGGAPVEQGPPNVPDAEPAFAEQTRAPEVKSGVELAVETLATGLVHPWGMALLPDGALLVTERPGRLRVVAADGTISDPLDGVPEVYAEGQGGLLDVALGRDFDTDRTIFLTYAKPVGDGLSATAAARARLSEDLTALTDVTDIFVQDPPAASRNHFGSRIVPEKAGTLFVTTGERFAPDQRVKAQDLGAGHGKIMRIREDGSASPDNPFVGEEGVQPTIYSWGHRNVQGAALDAEGKLWTIEHGPKGGDELNLISAGANYGWPVISYGVNYDGSPVGDGLTRALDMEQPVYYWDPVIAPGGMTFYDGELFPEWKGDLLIGSMKPGGLVRLALVDDTTAGARRVSGEERFLVGEGRVRDVEQAPDGALLLLIDADDGALLRVTPAPR
jgi:glucose/arabinose dehydrogenase